MSANRRAMVVLPEQLEPIITTRSISTFFISGSTQYLPNKFLGTLG